MDDKVEIPLKSNDRMKQEKNDDEDLSQMEEHKSKNGSMKITKEKTFDKKTLRITIDNS